MGHQVIVEGYTGRDKEIVGTDNGMVKGQGKEGTAFTYTGRNRHL
jgi:hypothetical protein